MATALFNPETATATDFEQSAARLEGLQLLACDITMEGLTDQMRADMKEIIDELAQIAQDRRNQANRMRGVMEDPAVTIPHLNEPLTTLEEQTRVAHAFGYGDDAHVLQQLQQDADDDAHKLLHRKGRVLLDLESNETSKQQLNGLVSHLQDDLNEVVYGQLEGLQDWTALPSEEEPSWAYERICEERLIWFDAGMMSEHTDTDGYLIADPFVSEEKQREIADGTLGKYFVSVFFSTDETAFDAMEAGLNQHDQGEAVRVALSDYMEQYPPLTVAGEIYTESDGQIVNPDTAYTAQQYTEIGRTLREALGMAYTGYFGPDAGDANGVSEDPFLMAVGAEDDTLLEQLGVRGLAEQLLEHIEGVEASEEGSREDGILRPFRVHEGDAGQNEAEPTLGELGEKLADLWYELLESRDPQTGVLVHIHEEAEQIKLALESEELHEFSTDLMRDCTILVNQVRDLMRLKKKQVEPVYALFTVYDRELLSQAVRDLITLLDDRDFTREEQEDFEFAISSFEEITHPARISDAHALWDVLLAWDRLGEYRNESDALCEFMMANHRKPEELAAEASVQTIAG